MFDPFDSPTFRLMQSLRRQQEEIARLSDPFGFASQANNWAKIHQSILGSPLAGILEVNARNKALFGGVKPFDIGAAREVAKAALPQLPLQKIVEQNQGRWVGSTAKALTSDAFMDRIGAVTNTAKLFEDSGIAKLARGLRPTLSAFEAVQAVTTLGELAAGIPELNKVAPLFPRTLEILRSTPDRFEGPEARAELQRELVEEGAAESSLDPNVLNFIISVVFFLLGCIHSEVKDYRTTDQLMDLEAEMKRAVAEREQNSQRVEEKVAENRELLLRIISTLEPVASGCVVELTTKSPVKAGKSPHSNSLGHFREGQHVLLLQIKGRRAQVRGQLNGMETTAWIAKKKLPKDGRCSLAEVFKVLPSSDAPPH